MWRIYIREHFIWKIFTIQVFHKYNIANQAKDEQLDKFLQ